MFSLLSQQVKLLEQLNAYTATELKSVCKNITFILESLNIEVSQLLATRREHGVLLPYMNKGRNLNVDEMNQLSLHQLLLNKSSLTQAVNTLCLSEAIVVRNNFNDCLESLAEKGDETFTALAGMNFTVDTSEKNHVGSTVKSNVSPIHLTQIKQRLAKATKSPSEKQIQVKNKLNSLLTPIKAPIKTHVKQA